MVNDITDKLSQKYNPRFGQIAVENAFVTPEQVKQAILEQIDDNLAQRPHRQLGMILLEKGWMNAQQVEAVLNELFLRAS
ncbi:MAG: hypothetical protein AMJ61_15540 [Desulfobacterales bacterium SG8_35_2]|nr:MAG: hypothetical protein AMJ61_15540 [Desulfobacterales bacterium SG8_35_2]